MGPDWLDLVIFVNLFFQGSVPQNGRIWQKGHQDGLGGAAATLSAATSQKCPCRHNNAPAAPGPQKVPKMDPEGKGLAPLVDPIGPY